MNLHERALKVLRASQVFGALGEVILNDLARHLTFQNVRGGTLVLPEGSASDSMLFVVTGGLRVSRREPSGALSLYNEVRPGQSVGEIGLILQQPRTADVTAVRDSCLAVLNLSVSYTHLDVYKRQPQGGEVRGNLAAGGKGVAQALTARDRFIAESIGPILNERGLLLVGLDVIGDSLTEINVTSPTCFQEIFDQTGFDVAAMFVDALESPLKC